MLIKLTIIGVLCLGSTLGYTIKGGTPVQLPITMSNPEDIRSFIRYEGPLYEVLACPQGLQFSSTKMKCVRNSKASVEEDSLRCPAFYVGTLGYEEDCRKFVNCWFGRGFLQECGSVLLYKDEHGKCDFPERANCCEYWEKSSGKLVM